MYVCFCNALTDRKVREAAAAGATRPADIYQACDCAAKCGTCARTLRKIIEEVVFPSCSDVAVAAK
jgi:bacterioferritin-associated ferredoxin